jgi:1-phosphatidylinositol-3-phosphate 5-kinase
MRLDGRFIAKEISRTELQTMETFAPAYFDYMLSSFTSGVGFFFRRACHDLTSCHQRPTLLAKIFGCFKVSYKTANHSGPDKPRTTQMNLVVMENLFYDRRFSRVRVCSRCFSSTYAVCLLPDLRSEGLD